jgi:hypothetical protein
VAKVRSIWERMLPAYVEPTAGKIKKPRNSNCRAFG